MHCTQVTTTQNAQLQLSEHVASSAVKRRGQFGETLRQKHMPGVVNQMQGITDYSSDCIGYIQPLTVET